MLAYVIRKILSSIPIIFGVALVTFMLFNVVGGDPTYQILGKNASPQQIAEVRSLYGFDQPWLVQFGNYLKQIATFDYGLSYASRRPISQMLIEGVGASLTLAIPAFLITTLIAIAIGLFVAYYRGTVIDKGVVVLCILGMSVPALAYILAGQYYLAFSWDLFPIHGYETSFPERFQYVALPILIWILVSLGYDVRFFRTAILEETGQDYVRTARAKGLNERRVFFKHVLKNSMVPIITNVVIQIPMLILGSLLLESFFGIPGVGGITIDAFNNSDVPVLRAMTTLTSLLFIFGNLVTDILYKVVDPRVTLK